MAWRGGSSIEVRDRSARSTRLAQLAWLASCLAVTEEMGAAVPTGPGVLRGGHRLNTEDARRRKLAIYTAVCGFDIFASHVADFAGVTRQQAAVWVREVEDWRARPESDELLERLLDLARGHLDERAAR